MRLAVTERFTRAYKALSPGDQALVDKAIALFAANLRHPSLQVNKIKGTQGLWEARASRSIRMTFEVHGDLVVLRNVGKHDETLKRP